MKNRRKYRRYYTAALAGLLVMSLASCGQAEETAEDLVSIPVSNEDGSSEGSSASVNEKNGIVAVSADAVNVMDVSGMFTDRDLRGDYDPDNCIKIELAEGSVRCDSETVSVSENKVVITEEGVYLLSGKLKDGMVVVDAPDTAKVQLVLGGVVISNSSNAAIYVKSADKVFITLAEGTTNSLSNEGGYTPLDGNNIDGVIFAKSDLTINGEGNLEITAKEGHGIVTKDDLKVTGGTLAVTAAGHGLSGKDSVRIAGGTFSVVSGKDGIRSEHDTDEEKGYLYIGDGGFTIVSEGDGISASSMLQIDGGSFVITAGGGSGMTVNEGSDAASTKGIKAGKILVVNEGDFVIDTSDDAFHSNGSLTVNGGELQIATGDDGIHADEEVTVAGGYVDITQSYEGIEGNDVVISGGQIKIYASDDGINAAGGRDGSGFGGFFGRDSFGGTDSSLLISGGSIYVNARGDGVDSNGSFSVTGGELYVSGPVSSGDGALDCDGEALITGGIVAAVGSSGMAMNFGEGSAQGSIFIAVPNQTAGTDVVVKDEEGKVLISYTPENAYNSIVVSCPDMVLGGTYTILAGDAQETVTLDNLIYGSGMGGFGGGRGGFGGHGGSGGMDMPKNMGTPEGAEMPDGMERPEGTEMPGGMERPEGAEMPGGMERPGNAEMSGGMERPEGSEMPGSTGGSKGMKNSGSRGGSETVPSA